VWPGSWFACAACAANGVAAGANESERSSSAALSVAISTLVMTALPDTANVISPPSKRQAVALPFEGIVRLFLSVRNRIPTSLLRKPPAPGFPPRPLVPNQVVPWLGRYSENHRPRGFPRGRWHLIRSCPG
jgi:hypothetical protein